MDDWRSHYLDDIRATFAAQRTLAERAMAQLDDAQLFRTLDDDGNSVAILLKHVGGNLRSRWRDIYETDGEKPDRDRDAEFETSPADDVAAVRRQWDDGWSVLEHTLAGLRPEDLQRTVTIRGETVSVVQALQRSLAHTAQHVGQIVLLARHFAGASWRSLSVPRRR
jgi:hypothetical protein